MDASDWDARYASADLVWSATPNQFLVEHTEAREPGTGLDLACGEGRNAIWLAGRGWTMTGVDFSPVAIDKARRIAAEVGATVDFSVADVTTWTPPARSYDLVLVFYLQLPSEQRPSVWTRAADAVTEGGSLLVVGHDLRNLTDGHGGPQSADVCYSADEITALLDDFDIEEAGEVIRRVPLASGGTADAIDCLVHATRRRDAP